MPADTTDGSWLAVYERWAGATDEPNLRDFIHYLRSHCNVQPGDVMTPEEWDELCERTNTEPEEQEELLMESAWP